ncbi:hypothetical protein V0R50_29125 [Pseudomonas sp. 148P]|uniref:Uncharacterized protein n=1 Tax=Pseudomonas ulcerans TaxID=3115852 RepID=A0ABU7I0Z5_9PSED|nr:MULTISPECIES: hypothetical protein [unclassified Pseudomonas]MEE1920347.1 hypothetical protein [Pseudomonas sp. 147P]MEE1937306.1 hypothetical protein [Pseudomonas sp. 148P]
MSIINGHGWQNIAVSQHRTLAAIPGADAQAYQSETATASAVSTVASASASRSASDSTYQDAKDAQDEAFAKLKVVLQNSGSSEASDSTSLSESDSTVKTTSAAQEFRDYMALSPEEKIRLKMLNELGLTEEDYEALPPEKKDAIDKQIAQRMKEESEIKSMAAVEPQMQAAVAATQALVKPVSEVDAADPAQARKDKENQEDPLNV